MVDREQLHRAIDALPPQELEKVNNFIESLNSNDEHKDPDWFGKLYDLFAPVRAEVEASGMTEDEVNQFLDEAIEEVRRERKA